MENIKISVVIAVYNGEKYLSQAINSILNQSYKKFEIIIINDGSTDNTKAILDSIEDPRAIIINQNNRGLSRSLNVGLSHAKGEYIARMDADDISFKERFKKQVSMLDKEQHIIAVGSNADVIDQYGEYVYTTNQKLTWDEIRNVLPHTPFIHPSVMFRRMGALDVGGYPEVYNEDRFFFNLLAAEGKFVNVKEPLIKYRIHPKSLSRKSKRTVELVNESFSYYLNNGKISDVLEKKIIQQRKSELTNRNYFYHLLLSKKYLWNNYNSKKSRKHSLQAIKESSGKEYLEPILLVLISYMNKYLIKKIYGILKE